MSHDCGARHTSSAAGIWPASIVDQCLNEGGAAAATTRLLPAAADEVSAHIAAPFSDGEAIRRRPAAAFHDQFTLAPTGAGAYASAEATNNEQQVLA